MTTQKFDTVTVTAPLEGRGMIVLVNIRPDKVAGHWVCDACGNRVHVTTKQSPLDRGKRHVNIEHGWKG